MLPVSIPSPSFILYVNRTWIKGPRNRTPVIDPTLRVIRFGKIQKEATTPSEFPWNSNWESIIPASCFYKTSSSQWSIHSWKSWKEKYFKWNIVRYPTIIDILFSYLLSGKKNFKNYNNHAPQTKRTKFLCPIALLRIHEKKKEKKKTNAPLSEQKFNRKNIRSYPPPEKFPVFGKKRSNFAATI